MVYVCVGAGVKQGELIAPDYKLTIDKKGLFLLFCIDSKRPNGFNTRLLQCSVQRANKKRHAQIAQSVEQWIENPRVPGSIPGLGTILKPEVRKSFGFFIARDFVLFTIAYRDPEGFFHG